MAKFEKSKEKKIRNRAYLEERLRALTEFRDLQFLYNIHPQNKNILLDYMKFLAYTDLTLPTASNAKGNLKLFLSWNLTYNGNKFFRKITLKEAELFFKWMREEGYTYTRANIVKTDLCDFADFMQFVVGKDERKHDGTKNRWYSYNGQFWKNVNTEQETDPNLIRKQNYSDFDKERIDTLHAYLKRKQDWMGVVILEYARFGSDILLLDIDDEDFNRQPSYAQSFLKWRVREGISEDMKRVCVMRTPNGEYMPMDIKTLRGYAKMFSIFLGKEFIIC